MGFHGNSKGYESWEERQKRKEKQRRNSLAYLRTDSNVSPHYSRKSSPIPDLSTVSLNFDRFRPPQKKNTPIPPLPKPKTISPPPHPPQNLNVKPKTFLPAKSVRFNLNSNFFRNNRPESRYPKPIPTRRPVSYLHPSNSPFKKISILPSKSPVPKQELSSEVTIKEVVEMEKYLGACNSANSFIKDVVFLNKKDPDTSNESKKVAPQKQFYSLNKTDAALENTKVKLWEMKFREPEEEDSGEEHLAIRSKYWEKIRGLQFEITYLKAAMEEDMKVEEVKREFVECETNIYQERSQGLSHVPEVLSPYVFNEPNLEGEVIPDIVSLLNQNREKIRNKWNKNFCKKFLVGFKKFGDDLEALSKSTNLPLKQVVEFYCANESEIFCD